MKRTPEKDECRPEYDFASMKGGVRGKYTRRFAAGSNVALIDPDLAKAFPTDRAVNDALWTVVRASRVLKRSKRVKASSAVSARARRSAE